MKECGLGDLPEWPWQRSRQEENAPNKRVFSLNVRVSCLAKGKKKRKHLKNNEVINLPTGTVDGPFSHLNRLLSGLESCFDGYLKIEMNKVSQRIDQIRLLHCINKNCQGGKRGKRGVRCGLCRNEIWSGVYSPSQEVLASPNSIRVPGM